MAAQNKIIVGIDIRDLQIAKTGQKTVTEELCIQFRNNKDPDLHFVFFDTTLPVYKGKNKYIIMSEHIRYQVWKQLILPIKAWWHNCDILFCGDYFVPFIHLGYETVEIFHDAFFFEYPNHYNKNWFKIFKFFALPAAKKCSYIMTVSEHAKKKIHLHTGIPLNKLVTIYNGPKTLVAPDAENKIVPARIKEILKEQYILHVGVLEKRKNLPALINAFKLFKDRSGSRLKLVLVGRGNGKLFSDDSEQVQNAISKNSLENEVILLGYLTDEHVAIVYKNAFMYAFPSFNEGFGIPVLEAFKFGLPVIVANNSSLPEVGGDAVLTFNPFDENDISNKIEEIVNNQVLRNELINKGHERLKEFSWEKTANQLIHVFKMAHINDR